MSIQKDYGKYILQCDTCPEAEEFDSWEAANAYRKAAGWKIWNFKSEWLHFCPECEVPV